MAAYGVKTLSYGVTDPPKKKQPAAVAAPNPLYRVMQSNPVSDVLNSAQVASGATRVDPIRTPTSPAPPSSTPAPPAAAPPPSDQPKPPQGGGNSNDLSGDPILAQLRAISGGYDASGNFVEGRSIADARTAALAAKKDAFIRGGFGDLAMKLLGDQNTASAAKQNPNSTLAQLLRAHQQQQQQIDTGANKANLYFSSTRGNQLGQESQNYLTNQSSAENALYDLLNQADSGVLSARNSAIDKYLGELPNAYQRALAAAATAPATVPPPGSDGSGSGGAGATGPETYFVVGPDGNLRPQSGRPARGIAAV